MSATMGDLLYVWPMNRDLRHQHFVNLLLLFFLQVALEINIWNIVFRVALEDKKLTIKNYPSPRVKKY